MTDAIDNKDAEAAEAAVAPATGNSVQADPAAPKPETASAEAKAEGTAIDKPGEPAAEAAFFAALSADEQAEASETYGPAIAGLMSSAGVNFKAVAEHWDKTGEIPAKVYDAFEGVGISRGMVDRYLDGVSAARSDVAAEGAEAAAAVLAIAGGEESYGRMVKWAAANYSPEEAAEYNEVLTGENTTVQAQRMAVKALVARYEAANGKLPPRSLTGRTAAAEAEADGDKFASSAEVIAAMKDPRYKRDAAYRQEVEAKTARSRVFGHAR